MWAFCSTRKIVVPDALISRMILKIVLHELRCQAERRLVQEQQRGTRQERAADGEHLLLAARKRPGPLGETLLQAGKEREHALAVARRPCGRRGRRRRGRGFSSTVRFGKMPRPSGTCAIPSRRILCAATPARFLPVERDRSAGCLQKAADGAKRRRLAGPVRADQRDDLSRLDGDRHAVERLDRAVVDGEVLDRKERHLYVAASMGSPR
jgi:hypothetical protein